MPMVGILQDNAMKIQNIAVIGGGLMGAGIAQVFASANYNVTLYEPNEDVRQSVNMRVMNNLKLVGKDQTIADLITTTNDLSEAVSHADYITEAIPEKLELKQSVYADLVSLAPHNAILASNTSVIPITKIAEGLDTANRIVGTHWWNPPYLVPLVEVVQAENTSQATINATMELLRNIGKKPAHVRKDLPGFVANRLQHALWREAIAMVAEGICDAATLDNCVKNSFGLRLPVLGPLENADLVGLDLTLDIHKTMIPELDRHDRPNAYLEEKVAQGKFGFKSGEGFRKWTPQQMDDLRIKLTEHLVKAKEERVNS